MTEEYGLKYKTQPMYMPKTGKIYGYECLLSIMDETYGEISPSVFIPVAQKYPAFMRKLDAWMIREIYRLNADCLQSQTEPPFLAINMDDVTVGDTVEFVNSVQRLRDEYKIDPEYIGFELHAQIIGSEAEESLLALRSDGFHIIIDNAEEENLSASLLLVDMIKISRRIVSTMTSNPRSLKAAQAIADFCRRCRVTCGALGVENANQEKLLLQMGVDVMQGYYYSRPCEHKF